MDRERTDARAHMRGKEIKKSKCEKARVQGKHFGLLLVELGIEPGAVTLTYTSISFYFSL